MTDVRIFDPLIKWNPLIPNRVIVGFNISVEPASPGETVPFNVYIEDGSDMYFSIDFGDGSDENTTFYLDSPDLNAANIQHTYLTAGAYNVSINLYNNRSSESRNIIAYIDDEMENLDITATHGDPSTPSEIAISLTAGTGITVFIVYNDNESMANQCCFENFGDITSFTHQFPEGIYDVQVRLSNSRGYLMRNVTIYSLLALGDINMEDVIYAATHEEANITWDVTAGSLVTCSWFFGDSSAWASCTDTVGMGNVIAHTFTAPGVHNATIQCQNSISLKSESMTIIVQDRIVGLEVVGDPAAIEGTPLAVPYTIVNGTDVTIEGYVDNIKQATKTNESMSEFLFDFNWVKGVTYKLDFHAYNKINSENLTFNINVYSGIADLSIVPVGSEPYFATDSTAQFRVTTTAGSIPNITVNFGDGDSENQFVNSEDPLDVTFGHTYSSPGEYLVEVNATNPADEQYNSTLIFIEVPVNADFLTFTTTNVTEPANSVDFSVSQSGGIAATNVQIKIVYGNEDFSTSCFGLGPSDPFAISNTYSDFGLYDVLATVFNNVSSVNLTAVTMVGVYILNPKVELLDAAAGKNYEASFAVGVDQGSQVTYRVDYGDGGSTGDIISNHTDYVSPDTVNFVHTYTSSGEFNMTATVSNVFGSVVDWEIISVLNPVVGGSVVANDAAYKTTEVFLLTATVDSGSQVTYEVTYPPMGESVSRNEFDLASIEVDLNASFSVPGLYSPIVTCSNLINNVNNTVSLPIIIQEPIVPITVTVNNPIRYPDQQAEYSISIPDSAADPTNITCKLTFQDASTVEETLVQFVSGGGLKTFKMNRTVPRADLGTHATNVECSNLVSSEIASVDVVVELAFNDVSLVPDIIFVAVGSNAPFTITALTASNGNYTLDFGDGSILVKTHAGLLEAGDKLNITHSYTTPGEYLVNMTATNAVDLEEVIGIDILYVEVELTDPMLEVVTSSPAPLPSGSVEFSINVKSGQPAPNRVIAEFNFDDGQTHTENAYSLFDGASVNVSHTFNTIGTYAVKINCSNEVSWVELEETVHVLEVLQGLTLSSSNFLKDGLFVAKVQDEVTFEAEVTHGNLITYQFDFDTENISTTYIPVVPKIADVHKSVTAEYTFTVPDNYTVSVHASNLVSELPNEELSDKFIVQREITSDDVVLTHMPILPLPATSVSFTLSLKPNAPEPTSVYYSFAFGDSESHGGFVPSWPFSISHEYSSATPGNLTPTVTLSNLVSSEDLESTLQVQETIADLDFDNPPLFSETDVQVKIKPSITAGSHIHFRVHFGIGTFKTQYMELSSAGFPEFSHMYTTAGDYTITVIAENGINVLNSSYSIHVDYSLRSLNLKAIEPVRMGSDGEFEFEVPDNRVPSDVDMKIDWGDGTEETVNNVDVTLPQSHTFNGVGFYSLFIELSNPVSAANWSELFIVEEPVSQPDFTMTLASDPAVTTFNMMDLIRFTAADNTGTNVTFKWEFARDGETRTTQETVYDYTYPIPGIYSVKLIAKNYVSDAEVTKEVSIAANIPFIDSVLMEKTFIATDPVIINIMLTGTVPKVCFEITFKEMFINGSSAVRKAFWSSTGQDYCKEKANVPFKTTNYHNFTENLVTFGTSFESSEVGTYGVKIRIVTDDLDEVMNNEIDIIPLPCSPPLMNKMNQNSTGHSHQDPTPYYKQDTVVARQSFFDIIIQCRATNQVEWEWKLYELEENSTAIGGYTTSEVDLLSVKAKVFQDSVMIEPGRMDIGLYKFTYTIEMFGRPAETATGQQFIRVVPSPLEAAIEGGDFAQYAVNQSQTISAYPGTQDPDRLSQSASELESKLTLTWACTEAGVPFNPENDMTNLSIHPQPTTKPDPKGICFGRGPQLIDMSNSAEWTLDTRLFDVGDTFTIWLKAERGERIAYAWQTIEIMNGEPPQIELRCNDKAKESNCAKKVNPQKTLFVTAACQERCGPSPTFKWFLHLSSDNENVLLDPPKTDDENQASHLKIVDGTLLEGRSYTLEVVVKVIYKNGEEKEAKKKMGLIVNMKPTKGNCTVYPPNGTALSSFEISQWGSIDEGGDMIFDGQMIGNPDAVLTYGYRYRIGDVVTEFSTRKPILPAGREIDGYRVNVDILIYDEYESYAICESKAIVHPPSDGEDVLVEQAEDNMKNIDNAILAVNPDASISTMLAVAATVTVLDKNAVDITENKVLDPVAKLHLMETEEGRKQIEEEENRMAIQEDYAQKFLELSKMNISVDLRLTTVKAVSEVSQSVNKETPASMVENTLESAETVTEHLSEMTTDQVVDAGEYVFQAISRVMKATTLEPPEPIEEVDQDIPVSEAEEERIRMLEEKEAENEKRRKVALIDTFTSVSTNMGESLYAIMSSQNRTEIKVQEEGIFVSTVLVKTEDLDSKDFGDRDIASVQVGNMTEDLGDEDGNVPDAVFFQVSQTAEVLYTLDDTADGLTAGITVCSLTDDSAEEMNINQMSTPLKLGIPQKVPEDLKANQDNMTIDEESGAIYMYIPADRDGEAFMSEIKKNESEARSLQFIVVVKFNATTNYSDPNNFPNETYYDMMAILPNHSTPNPSTFFIPEDNIVLPGSMIGIIPFDADDGDSGDNTTVRRRKRAAGDGGSSSNYTVPEMDIKPIIPVCKAYDTNADKWVTEGCKVDPNSEVKDNKLKCSCSKMTSNVRTYSGGFKSPKVNTINFSKIADNFLALVAGNPVVLSIIVVLFALWIILSLVLRRFDRKDVEKWSVAPLLDNKQHYSTAYKISVFTGMRQHAGTTSRVCFILTGDYGDTGVRVLDDGRGKFFSRNSVRHFVMTTDQQLGNMTFFRVWHDSSGPGNSASWYLTKIVVEDLQSNKKFFFLCNKWLAVDEEDGQLDRILPVAGKDEVTGFSHLFYSKAKKSLSEDHLWLSVASRPSKSHFTRCQRLACCVLLLFTTMLANCMFYRTDENTEGDFVLQVGPFVISASVILISIYGSLVVIPPNLIVTQLFRKSKPKLTAKEEEQKRKAMSTKQAIRGFLKQKYWFPHWVIYISWTITILISLLCGIMVIFYSLEWGAEKSNKWMSSLFLSTFQSVILVQPLKVLFLAAIIALIFRTLDDDNDEEEEEERRKALEAHNAKMASDEDPFALDPVLSLDRLNSAMVQVPPSGHNLDAVRLRRDREKRSKALIREVIFYIIFLLLISFIAWGNNDLNVYRMNANYYSLFDGTEVTDGESFWDWTENTVIPNLYSMYDYRPKPTTKRERKFTTDQYSFRVGPSRLRQLRVPPGKCTVSPEIKKAVKTCNIGYSWFDQEEKPFLPKWEKSPSANYTPESKAEDAFVYKSAIELVGLPYWGFFATYSGGGYIADLGITEGQARKMVEELKNNTWVDIYTRMVSFEFTTYNPNTNLFTYVLYAIEFPPSGGAFAYPRISSIQVYDGVGNGGKILLGAQVVYCFFLIYFIVKMCFDLKSMGAKKYFSEAWNVVEIIIIVASLIALAMFILKILVVNSIQGDLEENPDEYTNYQVLVEYISIWNIVLGLITFMATIKFLRILRFNRHIGELASTIRFLRWEVFQFTIIFFILMSSFACLANLSFGRQNESLSTFSKSLETLFSMLIGRFKLGEFEIPDQVMGSFFFISYSIVVFFIVLNLFIGILTYGYDQVRSNPLLRGDDHEIITYMMDVIKKVVFKYEPQRPIKTDSDDYAEALESLGLRLDSINQLLSVRHREFLEIREFQEKRLQSMTPTKSK